MKITVRNSKGTYDVAINGKAAAGRSEADEQGPGRGGVSSVWWRAEATLRSMISK